MRTSPRRDVPQAQPDRSDAWTRPRRPLDLYRDLALFRRGAYNAYLDLGESRDLRRRRSRALLPALPRRGAAAADEGHRGTRTGRRAGRSRASDLRADPQGAGWNVMIMDLMRNNISRIARNRHGACTALLTVERYATVLQLTSDITAQVRPGTGLAELFAALFPCGSVTWDLLRRHRLGCTTDRTRQRELQRRDPHRGDQPSRSDGCLRHRQRHHLELRTGSRASRGAGQDRDPAPPHALPPLRDHALRVGARDTEP